MSDRTQDLKNLRAVATACKNYVDETKEQILWQVGQYNITTQDDNTTAYQKVVPTGATRAKIKSIGGMSYKSENLIVVKRVNAVNNCSAVIGDDGLITITITNTSSTAACKFDIETIALASGSSYTANVFPIDIPMANASAMYLGVEGNQSAYSIGEQSESYQAKTITGSTVQPNLLYFYYNAIVTTTQVFKFKPMLVSGSTAPTEFKVGFTGIRDSVVTSVKSYNTDNELLDTYTVPSAITSLEGYGKGINSTVYNNVDFASGKYVENVKEFDLTTAENWRYNSSQKRWICDLPLTIEFSKYQNSSSILMCSKYKNVAYEKTYIGDPKDKICSGFHYQSSSTEYNYFTIKDSATEEYTPEQIVEYAATLKLLVKLVNPTETNITETAPLLEVEEGGYLVFENQYGQAVPSNITYRIEVAK